MNLSARFSIIREIKCCTFWSYTYLETLYNSVLVVLPFPETKQKKYDVRSRSYFPSVFLPFLRPNRGGCMLSVVSFMKPNLTHKIPIEFLHSHRASNPLEKDMQLNFHPFSSVIIPPSSPPLLYPSTQAKEQPFFPYHLLLLPSVQ